MKKITISKAAVVIALGLSSAVMAQSGAGSTGDDSIEMGDRPTGMGGPQDGFRPDPAMIVQHTSEAYAKIATYDANSDGILDEQEKAALADAVKDGTIAAPVRPDMDPERTPNPERVLQHVTRLYSTGYSYDTNKDGALDETEQAALKTAIENGELPPPGGPRGGPHGGKGQDGRHGGKGHDGPHGEKGQGGPRGDRPE